MSYDDTNFPGYSSDKYAAELKATLPEAYRERRHLVTELELLRKARASLAQNIEEARERLERFGHLEDETLTKLAEADELLREVSAFITRAEQGDQKQ